MVPFAMVRIFHPSLELAGGQIGKAMTNSSGRIMSRQNFTDVTQTMFEKYAWDTQPLTSRSRMKCAGFVQIGDIVMIGRITTTQCSLMLQDVKQATEM
jgi:hypothetical protein